MGHATTEAAPLGAEARQLLLYARDLKCMLDRERRQASELAAANARLGRLDRLKLDFLALVSHELRTPLTGISMVGLIDPDDLDEAHAEILRAVQAGYARLERFVAKTVDYFRMLAELDDSRDSVVDLRELVRSCLDPIAGKADVHADLAPGQHLVRGSEDALRKAVDAVLENGIKHCRGRRPALDVRLERRDAVVELSVRDDGVGFPPEMANEITRPLTPADILHHSEGTGLSLALASQIVASLGGSLVARSQGAGTGATFLIELPIAGRARVQPPPELLGGTQP